MTKQTTELAGDIKTSGLKATLPRIKVLEIFQHSLSAFGAQAPARGRRLQGAAGGGSEAAANKTSAVDTRIASRIAASLLGGWAFTWGFVTLGIALLVAAGMPYGEARTLLYLASGSPPW